MSDTRRILIFLYLLRADLNVLLMKAEATSPHYSPSFSARLSLPSPRRDGHERVAFRSLGRSRLSTRSISSFFFSRAFHSFAFLPLSRDLSLSFVSSLRLRGSHYTREPQHTVPMATRSLAIYVVSPPNVLPLPIYEIVPSL